jgi:hypothetical protein
MYFSSEPPTMGKKLPEKQMKKLLDPMGFLNEDEKKDYIGLDKEPTVNNLKEALKDKVETKPTINSPNVKEHIKDMPEEFGFKAKGPEPTRYGDWEKKGRVSDF